MAICERCGNETRAARPHADAYGSTRTAARRAGGIGTPNAPRRRDLHAEDAAPGGAHAESGSARLIATTRAAPGDAHAESGAAGLIATTRAAPEVAHAESGSAGLITATRAAPEVAHGEGGSAGLIAATRAAPEVAAEVLDAAAHLAASSISRNTQRAYGGALRTLDAWLAGRPLTDARLAAFVAELYRQGKAPGSASLAVAAARFRAKLAGQESPAGPATGRVLAGFRRDAAGRGRGQVDALGWRDADRAAGIAASGGRSLAGLRDAAVIAVGSDALLRVSELSALDVEDINTADSTLTVRRSKTDQEGRGAVQFLGAPTLGRIQAWRDAAGITAGPLFRPISRGGRALAGRLTDRSIRAIIQRRAREAGVKGRISGHSLRVGSAVSLALAGAALVELQNAGRWKSPSMPGHYCRGVMASKGAVARLRYKMA